MIRPLRTSSKFIHSVRTVFRNYRTIAIRSNFMMASASPPIQSKGPEPHRPGPAGATAIPAGESHSPVKPHPERIARKYLKTPIEKSIFVNVERSSSIMWNAAHLEKPTLWDPALNNNQRRDSNAIKWAGECQFKGSMGFPT